MKSTTTTHLLLPERIRRMAGMAAARKGQTLTEYVGDLIVADASATGIDALMDTEQLSQCDDDEVKR